MAKERTSVRMQAQIRKMSEQGYSLRGIARALRVSRKTVRRILGVSESTDPAQWTEAVDWDYVRKEVYGKGATIKQIHREVTPGIACVKFWRQFRDKVGHQASHRCSHHAVALST
ncbi:MAG: helix-turn-helix domain-containing protein [Deltaproteobacteria bacterium]|nr:helix-turn-helix domain-containing protein [Deltaproteobacteria bacterium]